MELKMSSNGAQMEHNGASMELQWSRGVVEGSKKVIKYIRYIIYFFYIIFISHFVHSSHVNHSSHGIHLSHAVHSSHALYWPHAIHSSHVFRSSHASHWSKCSLITRHHDTDHNQVGDFKGSAFGARAWVGCWMDLSSPGPSEMKNGKKTIISPCLWGLSARRKASGPERMVLWVSPWKHSFNDLEWSSNGVQWSSNGAQM